MVRCIYQSESDPTYSTDSLYITWGLARQSDDRTGRFCQWWGGRGDESVFTVIIGVVIRSVRVTAATTLNDPKHNCAYKIRAMRCGSSFPNTARDDCDESILWTNVFSPVLEWARQFRGTRTVTFLGKGARNTNEMFLSVATLAAMAHFAFYGSCLYVTYRGF
jgi:hypothetical protein